MEENIQEIMKRFSDLSETIHISKNGFELYIPKQGNTDEVGYFYVDAYKGHDCYAYDTVSTHKYFLISGEGDFIVNGKVVHKQAGDTITINPNEVFYYSGTMKLIEKISPKFEDKNFHVLQTVSYEGPVIENTTGGIAK